MDNADYNSVTVNARLCAYGTTLSIIRHMLIILQIQLFPLLILLNIFIQHSQTLVIEKILEHRTFEARERKSSAL